MWVEVEKNRLVKKNQIEWIHLEKFPEDIQKNTYAFRWRIHLKSGNSVLTRKFENEKQARQWAEQHLQI